MRGLCRHLGSRHLGSSHGERRVVSPRRAISARVLWYSLWAENTPHTCPILWQNSPISLTEIQKGKGGKALTQISTAASAGRALCPHLFILLCKHVSYEYLSFTRGKPHGLWNLCLSGHFLLMLVKFSYCNRIKYFLTFFFFKKNLSKTLFHI